MRNIILFCILALCLTGCRIYDIDEILLQRQDISLTERGNLVLAYEPQTFQIGHNSLINEFRVFDDNLGNWFVLTCNERPSTEGQTVKADLEWTSKTTTKSKKDLSFKVERTDSDGQIWLWCADHAIGIVVKEL